MLRLAWQTGSGLHLPKDEHRIQKKQIKNADTQKRGEEDQEQGATGRIREGVCRESELLKICDGILALVERRPKKCQSFATNETVTCENVSPDNKRDTEQPGRLSAQAEGSA